MTTPVCFSLFFSAIMMTIHSNRAGLSLSTPYEISIHFLPIRSKSRRRVRLRTMEDRLPPLDYRTGSMPLGSCQRPRPAGAGRGRVFSFVFFYYFLRSTFYFLVFSTTPNPLPSHFRPAKESS